MMVMMKLTDYDEDIPSFYIIVVRHYALSQQLFSSNYRQLGIALPMILADNSRILQIEQILRSIRSNKFVVV